MEVFTVINTLLYGVLAGWLGGELFKGSALGLIANIAAGITGGFIVYWLFVKLGINLGGGWFGYILTACTGAFILLTLLNLFIPRRI